MTKEEQKEYNRQYREKNKERLKAYKIKYKERDALKAKEYRESHKEEIAVKKREYYEKHKEADKVRKLAYMKKYNQRTKQRRKLYLHNRREIINQRRRDNIEEVKRKRKLYLIRNREKILETRRKWHARNKDCISHKRKEYRKDETKRLHKNKLGRESKWRNIEKTREYSRNYGKNNRRKIRQYVNNRLKTDINFKLAKCLRDRVSQVLKVNKDIKTGSAVRDLGCTVGEFKAYLESKFQPGMTWDNHTYNGWHLDHIIPVSSFNLTNREEFLKCFHYTNYQPLWAFDNKSKGNRINK